MHSQKRIAQNTLVTRCFISHTERGTRTPSVRTTKIRRGEEGEEGKRGEGGKRKIKKGREGGEETGEREERIKREDKEEKERKREFQLKTQQLDIEKARLKQMEESQRVHDEERATRRSLASRIKYFNEAFKRTELSAVS